MLKYKIRPHAPPALRAANVELQDQTPTSRRSTSAAMLKNKIRPRRSPMPRGRVGSLGRRIGLTEVAIVELRIDVVALHPDAGRIDGVAVGREPPVGLPQVPAD